MILDVYRPHSTWNLRNPNGIHGLGHAARVLVWADQIGQAMLQQGTPLDLEAVRWAAVLHDVRRVDDGRDGPHGPRSAEWLQVCSDPLPFAADPLRLQRVGYCCTWHTPDDRKAPEMTPELICLKDADALDRVRIYDLDPSRLRTPWAQALPDQAQELFDASSRVAGDPWSAVRQCALRMGLWR